MSMYTSFRKPSATKTVAFAVNYGDGRTAYLWLDGHNPADDHRVGSIAKERQEQGILPEGVIANVKRVR